jgi:hypothetical protein
MPSQQKGPLITYPYKPSTPAAAKTPKGQTRCFQCRKASTTREGEWRNQNQQQIFLCKTCLSKLTHRTSAT